RTKIVHFRQSNSSRVTHTAYDGGVVTSWEIGNDGRLSGVHGSVTAVDDSLDLALHDYASDYRSLPIVVGSKQSAGAVVQFQCRINQYVGNTELSELGTECTNDHRLTLGAFNDETANHHIVICLNKRAGADVGERSGGAGCRRWSRRTGRGRSWRGSGCWPRSSSRSRPRRGSRSGPGCRCRCLSAERCTC